MNYEGRLISSYYKTIDTISDKHQVYLAKHVESGEFFVKKDLTIYNKAVYDDLKHNPIVGIPRIYEVIEFFASDTGADSSSVADPHPQSPKKLTVIEEYIPGSSLTSIINSGALTPQASINYTIQLCNILNELHSRVPSIIHRDIKPDNIIIRPNGDLVLIDLNGAKYSDITSSRDTILFGTNEYAAPENFGFGSSIPQTDIYSLGITIRKMLQSFNSNILSYDEQAMVNTLTKIVEKSTQVDPQNRYQNVIEIRNKLENTQPKANVESKAYKRFFYKGTNRFLPPGFRSGNIRHMLIATPVYIFIIFFSLTFSSSDVYHDETTLMKIIYDVLIFFLMTDCVISFYNYLNIWNILSLFRHSNPYIRFVCKTALWMVLFFSKLSIIAMIYASIF